MTDHTKHKKSAKAPLSSPSVSPVWSIRTVDLFDDHKAKLTGPMLKRLERLIADIKENPETGIGKPERLKHSNEYRAEDTESVWSRRMDKKNRLVYRIDHRNRKVTLLRCRDHY